MVTRRYPLRERRLGRSSMAEIRRLGGKTNSGAHATKGQESRRGQVTERRRQLGADLAKARTAKRVRARKGY